MKIADLLHKSETASPMLVYHYDVHAWEYDCKFWLVNDKWCRDLDGKVVIARAQAGELELVSQFAPVIGQHEKENENWLAYQKCRKRTCICKSCSRFCHCASCKGKLVDCDKKG